MKGYCVVIEETISETFDVEATSEENAISRAIKEYKAGNFVVGSDNVEHRQISLVGENGELTDWIMF